MPTHQLVSSVSFFPLAV